MRHSKAYAISITLPQSTIDSQELNARCFQQSTKRLVKTIVDRDEYVNVGEEERQQKATARRISRAFTGWIKEGGRMAKVGKSTIEQGSRLSP